MSHQLQNVINTAIILELVNKRNNIQRLLMKHDFPVVFLKYTNSYLYSTITTFLQTPEVMC